ncbi:MAG: hypothetical protein ABI910_14880 [Gemmatimonadota bacterium]
MPTSRCRLVSCTAIFLVALATPVYPCGGPEHYPVDAPLVTADAYVQALQSVDDFDFRTRPELRFLYPFLAGARKGSSAMWMHSYADAAWNSFAALDTLAVFPMDELVSALWAAGRSGDAGTLEVAARALLAGSLDVPAVVADEYQPAVRRAVEALEVIDASRSAVPSPAGDIPLSVDLVRRLYGRASLVEPQSLPSWARDVVAVRSLPRDSMEAYADAHAGAPREGSLRFVGLQLAMRHDIPDGWARETRDSVPPERWRTLAAQHDEWMRHFPSHPVAPWVRLSRLRLAYFAGDSTAAWDVALSLYADHPWRALDEMRFLLRQSMHPPSLDDPRIDDTLRAALLGEVPLDAARWAREWGRAAVSAEPWAASARDRLLWRAAGNRDGTLRLPATTIAASAQPLSPLSSALRLVALVRGGRVQEAMAEVESLDSRRARETPDRQAESASIDSIVAPIRVQLLLAEHRWSDALHAPGLAIEARQYLVRVMAPDSALVDVGRSSDPMLSVEARRTRAMRRAAAGEWRSGSALLPRSDSSRAVAWRSTQSLAADSSLTGRLAFARHMRANNGRLFWGNDKVWYRSLNWRLRAISDTTSSDFNPVLPWRADEEVQAIARHFRGGFEMYFAVRAYADFLARAPRSDARRATALREADQTYNWLINWDNYNSTFWGEALEREGIGRTIRQAGRR